MTQFALEADRAAKDRGENKPANHVDAQIVQHGFARMAR